MATEVRFGVCVCANPLVTHKCCPSFTNSLFSPQHLSTFIMDKTESITTVDDAIKKLVLLDTKDKIWTQEMLLQVTDKAVRLLDCDTQVTKKMSR